MQRAEVRDQELRLRIADAEHMSLDRFEDLEGAISRSLVRALRSAVDQPERHNISQQFSPAGTRRYTSPRDAIQR